MFLALYSKYMLISVPFGIVLFVIFIVLESDDKAVQAFYCIYAIVTIIWTTVFLEHLKRSSSEKAVKWGQAELKEDEILRPQFEGKKR